MNIDDFYKNAIDCYERGNIVDSLANMRRIAELLAKFYIKKYNLTDAFNEQQKNNRNSNLFNSIVVFRNVYGHNHRGFKKKLLCFLEQAQEYGNEGVHPTSNKNVAGYKAEYLISYYGEYIKEKYEKDCINGSASQVFVDVTKCFNKHTICIYSCANNLYLSARADIINAPIQCNIKNANLWETFFVTVNEDGWACFKCFNELYISVRKDLRENEPQLYAMAAHVNSWEKFKIYQIGNKYCIKAQANGEWLTCRLDINDMQIQASRNVVDLWETFGIKIIR